MFNSFSRLLAATFAAISLFVLAGCGGGGGLPGVPGSGGGSTGPAPATCSSPVPSAPYMWGATAGNAQATVTFFPTSSTSYITNYVVTSNPGNISVSVPSTATAATVTGLTNGTTYTFTVTAYSCAGGSTASTASNAVIPATVPGAPTIGTATAGGSSATVTFAPPASNGGSAITSYTATSNPGGIMTTVAAPATSITVNGLTNGTSYTFTVTAANAMGTSTSSAASNAVVPASVPGAPTNVSAVAGNAQATVSWVAPTNTGGTAITGYTVTSSGGQVVTTTATTATVTGLTNGTSYFFTVTASNATGPSLSSAASNTVIPTTYFGPYYVNATTGLDTNVGSSAAPFKTITRGLTAAAGLGSATSVNVAAGSYSVGETFPLKMANNVTLIGAGAATTTISGSAGYTTAGGTYWNTTLVIPAGVTTTVSGFTVSGAIDVQVIVDASTLAAATNATLNNNIFTGVSSFSDSLYIYSPSTVSMTGNTMTGGWLNLVSISGNATVTARTNTLTSSGSAPAVSVSGGGTNLNSPVVNFGTSASAGGNKITGSTTNVGINIVNDGNVVNASGNTWKAAVQGSSATGTYAVGSVAVKPTTMTGGNNYAIDAASVNLQF